MKWGEYSSDVQFVLQRSDQQQQAKADATKQPPELKQLKDQKVASSSPINNSITDPQSASPVQVFERSKEIRKSFGYTKKLVKTMNHLTQFYLFL